MRFQPKRASGGGRVDTNDIPPSSFVPAAMDLMSAAQRDGKFVADLATERW
jgi:hypothetical protein